MDISIEWSQYILGYKYASMLQLSLKLLCFSPFPSLQSYSAHRWRWVLFPLLLQFANFCKIDKEWFHCNMLQAHLLVINNMMIINHQKYWACFWSCGCLFVSRELVTVVGGVCAVGRCSRRGLADSTWNKYKLKTCEIQVERFWECSTSVFILLFTFCFH